MTGVSENSYGDMYTIEAVISHSFNYDRFSHWGKNHFNICSVWKCLVLKVVSCFFMFVFMDTFRLGKLPQTLSELGESLKLLETLQGNVAKTEAQIRLIHEQFSILDKYEAPVEQDVSTSLMIKRMYVHAQWTVCVCINYMQSLFLHQCNIAQAIYPKTSVLLLLRCWLVKYI